MPLAGVVRGLLAAGGTGIVLDQTQRDTTGYLMTSTSPYSTSTYALPRLLLLLSGWGIYLAARQRRS